MKIAFHLYHFDVRGTTVAVFDYAYFNIKLLNNESIIIFPENAPKDERAFQKFQDHFETRTYNDKIDLENKTHDCDILYILKYGKNDGILSTKIKTVIHCVFDLSEPHGNVYAGISQSLVNKYNYPLFVPHMINLTIPDKFNLLRDQLEIPSNAIVYGRHGGEDTFDLQFAKDAIITIVLTCIDKYFIFINTPKFFDHPQIFFLRSFVDINKKIEFIMSCDAYLECGKLGHSFGLAIGEFSLCNKPIIAYNGPVWNRSHLDILQDKGLYFTTMEEFITILANFNPEEFKNKDNNCYREYSPENVMKRFYDVFIN